jgi:hypothetical protein
LRGDWPDGSAGERVRVMRLLGAGTGKKEVEGREASLETAWMVRGRAHGMPCAFVRT